MKSFWDSCEMYKISTVVVLISGALVRSRLIYERYLHLIDIFAYRSAHNNLFLRPGSHAELFMSRT